MSDLYDELGVARDATPEEIKAAHRRKVRVHHPDAGGDKQTFQRVQIAYDTLKDEDSRKRYDDTGEIPSAEQPDRVLQALAEIFEGMVGEMLTEGRSIETTDLRQEMKDIVAKRANDIAGERAKVEGQLKRAGVLAKRWKRKRKAKDFDLMQTTLQRRQRDLTEQIRKMEEAEAIWNRAGEVLDDYTYKFDDRTPKPDFSGFTVHFTDMAGVRFDNS